ncbi:Hypothetical predicted protein [Mytilus galloprovincialis]|uniref:Uncharacterized protein n=1 Tax=Mytilus galloprovincialis TaxID=29158 RepID=A0A8B6CQU5_MYTGA|nr:Hypothetical predicted protein [Mytilus galloprovincialis]
MAKVKEIDYIKRLEISSRMVIWYLSLKSTHSDGLCFENNFEYYTKYILFLRELVPSAPLYRTYSAELPFSRLTEVKGICENSNICEEGKDSCFSGTGTKTNYVWTIMCVPLLLMYLGHFT